MRIPLKWYDSTLDILDKPHYVPVLYILSRRDFFASTAFYAFISGFGTFVSFCL